MLSIFLGSMNFSILTMVFSVKYCKTFSFWLVRNAAKQMTLTWGLVAYFIIVCITTTTYFEPDQVFFVSIHLGKFLPGVFAKILAKGFCKPPRLTLGIFANFHVYCNLPVYYFGRNLPASQFIPPYSSIWNSKVECPQKQNAYHCFSIGCGVSATERWRWPNKDRLNIQIS